MKSKRERANSRTLVLDVPWATEARTQKEAALRRYNEYRVAMEAVRAGISKKAPAPAFMCDPWFRLLVATNIISDAQRRAPNRDARLPAKRRRTMEMRLGHLNDAEIALATAEQCLVVRSHNSSSTLAAMYDLAQAVERLRHHSIPSHIAARNASRAPSWLRQQIRDRILKTAGTETAKEMMALIESGATSPARFANIVSEEKRAFRKTFTGQPVP